jgi:hypothetical protein
MQAGFAAIWRADQSCGQLGGGLREPTGTRMRKILQILAALCLCLVGMQAAYAGDERFPKAGNPALSFHMPDAWTSEVDSEGNLILTSDDRTAAFSLTLAEGNENVDALASEAAKFAGATPPQRNGYAEISAFPGAVYFSTMKNEAGASLNLKMVIVKIGTSHMVSVTRITVSDISSGSLEAAEAVLKSMKLSPP